MHKKKRAQVTVYIILGIIILSSAILLFYLRGRTEKDNLQYYDWQELKIDIIRES